MKKLLLVPFLLFAVIANCQLDLPPGVVDGINYEQGNLF